MADPVVANAVYPSSSSGFLTFDAYGIDHAVRTVSVEIASGDGAVTVFSLGAIVAASYISGGSTVSGVGTQASPYHFSLRPSGGWPATGNRPHAVTLRLETGEVKTYLLDYTAFSHTRATPAFAPTSDGYYRHYPANTLRPHPTLSHTWLFEPKGLHFARDNLRGLMNRAFDETGFNTNWTAVNCVPEWFALEGGFWTPMKEWTPIGEQAIECVVSANGDASISQNVANNGGMTIAQVVCSVFVKVATGQAVPANGVQLIATTNAGATVVTKNITPTSSWVRHWIYITPATSPNNKITLTLKLPSATAGDRVMWALPACVGHGNSANLVQPLQPYPYIGFGQSQTSSDGDSLLIPAASVPSAMRGLGGAFGFTWIPTFDARGPYPATPSADVTFFSCGDLYREILWAPARDGSIWIRADNAQQNTNPWLRSQPLEFNAGDVIEVIVSPTTAKISVSGCSVSGNGLGPTTYTTFTPPSSPQVYTWNSNDMIVGDRVAVLGYARGSHMGAGYISEPYAASVL